MRTFSRDWEPDSASVNAVAADSPEWPYGEVRVLSSERIGAGYGLSGGDIYRVDACGEGGESVSFVMKREGAEATTRALAFHRTVGARAAPSIPACLGGQVSAHADEGLLLLEAIIPSEQGDVLRGCTDAQALAAVRSLAHVHAAGFNANSEARAQITSRWDARAADPDAWRSRIAAASTRFPDIVTPDVRDRLEALPHKAADALESLQARTNTVIHRDAHLDNVLFRADGSAVIIDWSGAAVGPAAIDLAHLLTSGIRAGSREDLAPTLMTAYTREWTAKTREPFRDDPWESLSSGLILLTQAALGWAAREEHREPARMRALQENLLRSVCAWTSNTHMTEPGRLFAST
jgi:Ser/Thr protein kinase RdoA (MazF antagonist)